jgi:hypothetical protein
VSPLRDPHQVGAAGDRDTADDLLVPALPGAVVTPEVRCAPAGNGWSCQVSITDRGRVASTHVVSVAEVDLARLDPGAPSPDDLVRRSFAFLLEREPPTSILRSFDLTVIARYFPEYEAEIRRRR